ncbi:MAG: hypothetical protein ABII09_06585 [Planctomycetota bacterium]
MCRNLILSVLVVCVLTAGASIVNAEPLITVNGLNPVDSPLTIEGSEQLLLAVEGNSPTEPKNVSVTASGGTLQPAAEEAIFIRDGTMKQGQKFLQYGKLNIKDGLGLNGTH